MATLTDESGNDLTDELGNVLTDEESTYALSVLAGAYTLTGVAITLSRTVASAIRVHFRRKKV